MLPQARVFAGVLAILGLACTNDRAAAAWPDRPIRVIVSFPAGSSTDIPARIVAQHLSVRLGQPLVIENVAGAAGAVGARAIARAPADGYTIGLASSSAFSIMPTVQANLLYDPLRDFAPLSLIGRSPYVIVASPTLQVKTLPELVAYARANPGTLNYGTAGANSLTHLATLFLASMTKTTFNHVPYRSSAAAGSDLMAGRIHFQISGVAAALQLITAGVTPLAVTSERRVASLPNIPTAIEFGRAGLRRFVLARLRCAGRHAARHRRAVEQRGERRPRDARGPQRARRTRPRRRGNLAGGFQQADRGRNRPVAGRGEGRGPEAGVISSVIPGARDSENPVVIQIDA